MLQIAIWGMCIMLIVKAVEMMQMQSLAKNPETGATPFTIAGTVIAIAGAIVLFAFASGQASELPSSFAGSSFSDSGEYNAESMTEADAAATDVEANLQAAGDAVAAAARDIDAAAEADVAAAEAEVAAAELEGF